MKTTTFNIIGMHCTSCAMLIDGDLEDTPGVKSASTNFAKAITEVSFDEKIINNGKIVKIIEKTGYKSNPVVR